MSKEYCIAHHGDKMCFLPNSIYLIKIKGDIKKLLEKLDTFCLDYQHMNCLYTLQKWPISGKCVVKSGYFFDNMQRVVIFNHQNRGMDRMASIAKKRLLSRKYRKHLLIFFQKTKSTQTSGSVFPDTIEQIIQSQKNLINSFEQDWRKRLSHLSSQVKYCKTSSLDRERLGFAEKTREDMVGGPSYVFTRWPVVEKIFIRDSTNWCKCNAMSDLMPVNLIVSLCGEQWPLACTRDGSYVRNLEILICVKPRRGVLETC